MSWSEGAKVVIPIDEIKNAPETPGVPPPAPKKGIEEYTRFDLATGQILGTGMRQTTEGVAAVSVGSGASEGTGYMPGRAQVNDQYVDLASGELRDKTESGATISRTRLPLGETVTLSGLPVGCIVQVEGTGEDYPVDDGVLTFTPSSVGEYDVAMRHAQHFIKKWTFEVTE